MISKNQIKYVNQLEQKKYRQREGRFVAEGPKVVGDLLSCGFQPSMLFATAEWQQAHHYPAQEVTAEELRKLSFLKHPQQVLAVFPIPEQPLASAPGAGMSQTEASQPALYLALDGIQDPGNLGTIIRLADWFGITSIICSEDTADAWNPKVVQATMGSIARVPIFYTDLLQWLRHTSLPVYGTLLDGDNIYEQELTSEGIIVMGNEGNGISQPVRQLITRRLLIPSYQPGAESLNVAIATAITCSEFRRRRKK